MKKIITILLVPGFALAVNAIAAAGANLLPNPTFDTDISGWDINPFVAEPNARWSDEDAGGSAASGSAETDFIGAGNGGTQTGLFVCLPSEPGREYRFGGAARLKQETEGAAPYIFVGAYGDDVCVDWLDGHSIGFFPVSTDWQDFESGFVTPPGTDHIRFVIGTQKSSGFDDPLGSRFDDLFLIEIVDNEVFEDRFEGP